MKIISVKQPRSTTVIKLVSREQSGPIPDFTGEPGEITVRYDRKEAVIYGGTGDRLSCTPAIVRTTAAKAVQKVMEIKRTAVAFVNSEKEKRLAKAAIEGIALGSYRFSKYKSEKTGSLDLLECVQFPLDNSEIAAIATVCECVNYARDLVNENAHEVTPERLATEARQFSRKPGFKVTVLDEKEIARKKLGLIKAVGQSSPTPPRLIIIEYAGPRSPKGGSTAIIGKGVTFDSGGQNLKPTGSIETMREDMAGAAAVLGVMKAVSLLRPSLRLIGVIPAAHNNIGADSYFPGDIYRSYAGKTVEVLSTDAEGRLLLADAIAWCRKNHKPDRIIDLATLTGGILSTFADVVAGVFSNNDRLADGLFRAGETTGERLWRLPLYKEYSDSLKSDIADLRNLSKMKKGQASSITGAAFIKEFAGETPWAHLDIAGTAFNEGPSKGEIPQFGTGFGVRLLLEFLLNPNRAQ